MQDLRRTLKVILTTRGQQLWQVSLQGDKKAALLLVSKVPMMAVLLIFIIILYLLYSVKN